MSAAAPPPGLPGEDGEPAKAPQVVEVEASIERREVVVLTPCLCGWRPETVDPRVILAVRQRKEFSTPCRCGRMLHYAANVVKLATKLPSGRVQ